MKKHSSPKNARKGLIVIVAFVAILVCSMMWMSRPSTQTREKAQGDWEPVTAESLRKDHEREVSKAVVPEAVTSADGSLTLIPQSMQLSKKVLVNKAWNSDANAFGRDPGNEAATMGPSAIAYQEGVLYVLDSVHNRILRYDKAGNLMSSVPLPAPVTSDLVINPVDSSLFVIDHYKNNIFKVAGDDVALLQSLPLREKFPIGTKFGYDAASDTLYLRDPQTGADVPLIKNGEPLEIGAWNTEMFSPATVQIQDQNLILALKDGKKMSITFDKPLMDATEAVIDGQGNVWALFTLEDDYRVQRLARIDPARGTVGVAEIDIWFSFDGTRRMTATENGVVFVAGDEHEGRLLAFDYAGGDL